MNVEEEGIKKKLFKKKKKLKSPLVIEARREHFVKLT